MQELKKKFESFFIVAIMGFGKVNQEVIDKTWEWINENFVSYDKILELFPLELYDETPLELIINLKDKNEQLETDLQAELTKGEKIVFDDADMRYIANRIDPSFYDIEIEGADKAKEEVIRKLKIILNDCLNRDKE
jgi:hypothetical protein